jgi:hypothetical protein
LLSFDELLEHLALRSSKRLDIWISERTQHADLSLSDVDALELTYYRYPSGRHCLYTLWFEGRKIGQTLLPVYSAADDLNLASTIATSEEF